MAYNLLGLRSSVRTKIKDTSYSAGTIDEYINDAIAEIAGLYPFKYFQKVVDGSLTIGEYVYAQQDDHETTIRLLLIDPVTTSSYFDITSNRVSSDHFFEFYGVPSEQVNGQPSIWTEFGNQLYFNCPVDKTYTLRQFYQKIPTLLETDSSAPELPSTFREAIVLGAAYRCEEERGNYDIASVLQNRFSDKVGDIIMRLSNDTMSGPDTVIIPQTIGDPRMRDW